MHYIRAIELFAECIPSTIIQSLAFFRGQQTVLAATSLVSSIITAAFIATSITIEKDIGVGRKHSPGIYGFVPVGSITKTICSENKCILYGPFLKCRISAWLEFLHRHDLIHFLQQLNNVTCLLCWKGRIDQLRRDVKKTARINKRDYPADVLDVDTHSPTMGTGPSMNDVISKKSASFDHLPPPLMTFPIT